MKWIIQDWASNRLFPAKTFDTFEDGWEFVRENFPDEKDWEDIYVIQSENF